jgi:protein-disulfide isomerase
MAKKTAAQEPGSPDLKGLVSWAAVVLAAIALWFAWSAKQELAAIKSDTASKLTAMDAKVGEAVQKVAQAQARQQQPQQRGPDPNKVYPVKLEGTPIKGPATAPITIVEVSDFQCPFCSRVVPTLEKVEQVYGPLVRRAFKHYPLPFHKDAPLAHLASIAAQEQGKFWEYKQLLFANQKDLSRAALLAHARKLGLDMQKFEAGLASMPAKQRVVAEMNEAEAIGITGTPGFLINGRFLGGAQPFEAFAKLINQELQKQGIPIPAGAGGV